MKMCLWPENERPIEKLLAHGLSKLSDAELLAIILGQGMAKINVVDLARQMLVDYGGLIGLLSQADKTLLKIKGVGPTKLARIRAIQGLMQRSLTQQHSARMVVKDEADVLTQVNPLLAHAVQEKIIGIFLDQKSQLIQTCELGLGTMQKSMVYPRQIAKVALELAATRLILVHNHPSGDLTPSAADIDMTHFLRRSLLPFEIDLLAHYVYANGQLVFIM